MKTMTIEEFKTEFKRRAAAGRKRYMADRGILFSAAMVRALLDGRKTQTRRLASFVKDQPDGFYHCRGNGGGMVGMDFVQVRELGVDYAPYAPGDRLWVREAWRTQKAVDELKPSQMTGLGRVWYEADTRDNCDQHGRLRPGMFMPRWASRLWLTVTDVRIQRLQDISEADAIAEGIVSRTVITGVNCNGRTHSEETATLYFNGTEPYDFIGHEYASDAYADLWDRLNMKAGTRWQDNPWVFTTTFTVHHGNLGRDRA